MVRDMPNDYNYQNTFEEVIVDKHSNLLIIGAASTDYSELSPSFESDPIAVAEKYGAESDLTKAFNLAQSLGVEYIFLLNVRTHYDFLDLAEVINQYDFAYIAPIGIYISETFNDPHDNNRKTSYYAYLMSKLSKQNESVFVVTDQHASLFEDLDAFLEYMNTVDREFIYGCYPSVNFENIILVANTLEDTNMANIYLAAALATTEVCYYPTVSVPPTVIRIDHTDEVGSWTYFQEHTNRETTIENMLNHLVIGNPLKIVTISRIIKIIKRELDFSEFHGRLYSEYQRLLIAKKLERYLKKLVNYAIRDYRIDSVQAYKGLPGTVTVLNRFAVLPINCMEWIHIEKEVEIGL